MPSLLVVSVDAIDNTFDSQQAHNDCNSDSSSDMEAPARKKSRMTTMTTTRPRARASVPREIDYAGGDKERARNFVTWEDNALSTAFVSTSKDPIVGRGMTGVEFFSKMHRKWVILHRSADIKDKRYEQPRSLKQLICRWNKHIRKDMMIFLKHYRNVKNEKLSGYTEKEHIGMAADRFHDVVGKKFRFKECVPILQDLPKFNISHIASKKKKQKYSSPDDSEEDDDEDSEDDHDKEDEDEVVVEPGGDEEEDEQLSEESTPPTDANNSTRNIVSRSSTPSLINDIAPTFNSGATRPIGTKAAKARLYAIRAARKNGGKATPSPGTTHQSSLNTDRVAALQDGVKEMQGIKTEVSMIRKNQQQQFMFESLMRLGEKEEAREYLMN